VATGEIALTVITTGVDIDANGYSVRVAPGSNRRIGPTETIRCPDSCPASTRCPGGPRTHFAVAGNGAVLFRQSRSGGTLCRSTRSRPTAMRTTDSCDM
jgi:hypothetical protein